MKKLIIAAAMFVSLSSFAKENSVTPQVLNAFKSEFASAQEVEWTISADYYKASFGMNGQRVFAFYNMDGELMGLSRNISSAQLPVKLQGNLKKEYAGYWISDLFEIANTEGTTYYVTMENGDKKVVLKSAAGSEWNTYKTKRKI